MADAVTALWRVDGTAGDGSAPPNPGVSSANSNVGTRRRKQWLDAGSCRTISTFFTSTRILDMMRLIHSVTNSRPSWAAASHSLPARGGAAGCGVAEEGAASGLDVPEGLPAADALAGAA